MEAAKPKKKPAFTFKELLFAYLAISKLMYWMNNIAAIQQDELGEVWRMVLNRLLGQDIMTIWILIAMFLLDHYVKTHPSIKKGSIRDILIYGIGYVIYIVSIIVYTWVLGLFSLAQINNWGAFILNFSIFYVAACVVLGVKERVKKKEAELYIENEKEVE